jgi:hypothetical protein
MIRLRHCALVLAAGAALSFVGCRSRQIHPSIQTKRLRRFALVAFYGPRHIGAGGVGIVGAFQSSNKWGEKLAKGLIDDVHGRLSHAMGSDLIPIGRVVGSPGYNKLPLTDSFPDNQTVCRGLRPLSVAAEHDGGLARLARELGVDAVIAIRNIWSVQDRENETQFGHDIIEILVVDADGTRLWYDKNYVEAGPPELTLKQLGREVVGAVSEKSAIAMTRDAVLVGLDRFCRDWQKHVPRASAP